MWSVTVAPRDRAERGPDSPEALAAFQSALVETLALNLAPADARAKLASDPRTRNLQDYVQTFDVRALEVLTELMALWGERTPRSSPRSAAVRDRRPPDGRDRSGRARRSANSR
jgi:hypothetical protein